MIRSCYSAIYYCLLIYSDLVNCFFFMICVFYDSFDTAKYYSTSKSTAMGCELAMGRAHSFMLIFRSGRVGLGHFISGSSLVGSSKLDPRPTLNCAMAHH